MYHKYIGIFVNYWTKKIKDEVTSIILCSVFLNVLLVLNTQQVMSLLFNMLSRLVITPSKE